MGYTYYETYNNTQKLRKDVKKMKKRLFYATVSLGVLGGSIIAIPSFANEVNTLSNNADTAFHFTFTPSIVGSSAYTGVRHKENATSAYMKANSRSKNQQFTASVVKSNNGNFSKTWFVDIATINAEYFIPNYAYEDQGYGVNVKIKGQTGDLFGFDVSGVWSPDSV